MNFLLCLLIALAYLCVLTVNCRSVQIDSDTRSVDTDGNHATQSRGIFSWIRLKPLLRREVQRVKNVKGETNKFTQGPVETASLVPPKDNENLISENKVLGINEKNSLKPESPVTNTTSIIKSELAEHSHTEDPKMKSNVTEEFISSTTDVQMHETDHPLVANDFPDNVISDILNQSGDSIFLQTLNDNSSNIDSIEFDETSLLSEGGHIAMLQEVSTIGFELLIDSETKQNSILTELLNSQSNLIDDDDGLSDDNFDEDFVTIQFDDSDESELQETVTNVKSMGNLDVEFSTHEAETENTEFGSDEDKTENAKFSSDEEKTENTESGSDEAKTENTESGSDETKVENIESSSDEAMTENTEFGSDEAKTESTEFDSDENKSENIEFVSDEAKIENTESGSDEAKTESTEFDSDENKSENIEFVSDEAKTEATDFVTGEIKNVLNELDSEDSVPDEKVTEISNIEPENPKCPDPGWCVFWFMAIDLCANDSHCHGSLLCCTIGCSKTCIDADDDFL